MPTKNSRGEVDLGNSAKSNSGSRRTRIFTNADDIRASLRTQDQASLVEALTALRNQFTIRTDEDVLAPQDKRLLLAQHWLENVPGAHDIFGIWDDINQRQTSTLALLVSVLSSLLKLLSSHYTFHTFGLPILKTLLTSSCMRRLNSYLGGSHPELILVTMKLFNAMSEFAGGRERKSILESFGWETKSLPRLLNMRRKGKKIEYSDSLARPDIRSLYILFILSFVGPDSPTQIKMTFLEQHRDQFLSIFKGLAQDSYSVMRKVLEVCWGGIWSDPKMKRTLKVGLFNENTIFQIMKLYDRAVSDDDKPDHVPADLIHHFLLAICTRPGNGICFKDRGWYPRDVDGDNGISNNDDDDDFTIRQGGKVYNKILSKILKRLKVNEDPRQRELAFKIISACPELVAGYWAGAALTLEPRLSSKWIANISFFGSIISLPIPSSSFILLNTTLYQPTPPPLSIIMENILPSVNTKLHLSKGLQSPSGLVQHCTAIAFTKCLAKYNEVVKLFHHVEAALGEDEVSGQWNKRRLDIEREVRRRVPDFQVVVAFSQQNFGDGASMFGTSPALPNQTKAGLLSESAQRLLWMYQRCLPLVVSEARFDVGKLLQHLSLETRAANVNVGDNVQEASLSVTARLHLVRQLHVLRLLKDSDQFIWSGKMGSSSHSYLYVLLKSFIISEIPATRTVLAALLRHVLSESIMFQEDPDEPDLWLMSLPTTQRASGAASPDGAALTDESDGVVAFLDDCVQRCLKTPYRYIEELYSLSNTGHHHSSNGPPSPLLMTVIEQLDAKTGKETLSPSDVLALASFVRKLLFQLSSKQQDMQFLRAMALKVDSILLPPRLFPQYPIITTAIRREVSLLHTCLQPHRHIFTSATPAASNVQDFLAQIELLTIPASRISRLIAAFELIDWLRLVDQPLGPDEILRLSDVVSKLYKPALMELGENLDPTQTSFWDGPGVACRNILTEIAVGNSASLVDLRRVAQFIMHRFSSSQGQDDVTRALLFLLASVLKRSSTILSYADFGSLKETIFVRSNIIKDNLISKSLSDIVREGFHRLVENSLNPDDQNDRQLIADISIHWVNTLKMSLQSGAAIQAAFVTIWIKYLHSTDLFDLLDVLADDTEKNSSSFEDLITTVLVALRASIVSEVESEVALMQRLPRLLVLRPVLADSVILEEVIAIAVDASLPICCGGGRLYGKDFEEKSIVSVVRRSDMRWSRRSNFLQIDSQIQSFLTQDAWSVSTAGIISGLIYGGFFSKGLFLSWIGTVQSTHRSKEHLASVMHAFLDKYSQGSEFTARESDAWVPHFSWFLSTVVDEKLDQELRSTSRSCLSLILALMPSKLSELLAVATQYTQALPVTCLTVDILVFACELYAKMPLEAVHLTSVLANHGLEWIVRRLSDHDDVSVDTARIVEEMTSLVQVAPAIKSHLVETVMGVIIQHRLSTVSALEFLTVLLSVVQPKPLVVNRYLQAIIQHPQFFKICANTVPDVSRTAVIKLLHVMFNLHPSNTCQVTHVEPLLRIYRGTLSSSDSQLLSIFRLFETQRNTSVASLLSRWSSSPTLTSSTSLEAVLSLDAIVVLRTCLSFPRWRRLNDPPTDQADAHEMQLYDPVFLILLFAQALAESPPASAFAWVELFRTNIVSLLIKALSSKDGAIRDLALCQIAAIWKYLSTADMQEKPHVVHILTLLKDVLPPPSADPPKRLPSYTTLTLMHALRGIFYPSNFIYPITARFLLQRPEIDINDVPMLYDMLYNSSDNWKKERGWIIRFLSDGMMSTEDWRVFKRRHTWDLLASLFQSSEDDRTLRQGIFEVLANLTCNAQATTSLVLKSGLLTWIEMQLLNTIENEGIKWIKIIENIMVIVDSAKLENSTNGEWRAVILRCLSMLLHNDNHSNTSAVFPFVVPVMLRLSLLPGRPLMALPELLYRAVACLKRLETTVIVPPATMQRSTLQVSRGPLFKAYEVHEPYPAAEPLQIWGACIEALWRVAMNLKHKGPSWDMLTSRLLIWRAIVGAEGSVVGEWARTQVIRNISSADK